RRVRPGARRGDHRPGTPDCEEGRREPLPLRHPAARRGRDALLRRLMIRELLSYRLHEVANLLSRGAELRYRREFGVSLWEWRTIALLGGATEPLSLNHLAHAAGIDKSQMSRVVSALANRKLVVRDANADDGRGVHLTLSKAGRKLYAG